MFKLTSLVLASALMSKFFPMAIAPSLCVYLSTEDEGDWCSSSELLFCRHRATFVTGPQPALNMDQPAASKNVEAQQTVAVAAVAGKAMLPPASKASVPSMGNTETRSTALPQREVGTSRQDGAVLSQCLSSPSLLALITHSWPADGARQATMKAAADAATAAAHLTPAQRERAINEAASQVKHMQCIAHAQYN